MKAFLLLIFLFQICLLKAQFVDSSYIFIEAGYSEKILTYTGPDLNVDIIDGPKFSKQKSRIFTFSTTAFLAWHKPFFIKNNWSAGLNLGAGINIDYVGDRFTGKSAVIGWAFPEYVFLSYMTKNHRLFSLFGGYKYSGAFFPSHQKMIGIELPVFKDFSVRLTGSIFPYYYYVIYSNDILEPDLKIQEVSLSFFMEM